MTLADQIERVLGEERFRKIKEYKFSDTARAIVGENRYSNLKKSLHRILVEHQYSNERVQNAAKKVYEILKEVEKETYYGSAIDGISLNIASLPFILNDKYGARKNWVGAAGTRASAFIPNFITGRIYGSWQDYFIAKIDEKIDITNEPNKVKRFFKNWFAKSSAFATGQSWLYALYLKGGDLISGEETDWYRLGIGALILTVSSPIIGPYADKLYQELRHQFGLPKIPGYRAKTRQN